MMISHSSPRLAAEKSVQLPHRSVTRIDNVILMRVVHICRTGFKKQYKNPLLAVCLIRYSFDCSFVQLSPCNLD
jgi:hypothetical protein